MCVPGLQSPCLEAFGANQKVLLSSNTYDNQAHSRKERNSAEDGRDGNGLLLLVGDLEGAKIYVFFLVGEAESARDESDHSEDDENNSYDCCGFHGDSLSDAMRLYW